MTLVMTSLTIFFNYALKKALLGPMLESLPDKENKIILLGSSTPFQKELYYWVYHTIKITYLPTNPKNPGNSVYKKYLNFYRITRVNIYIRSCLWTSVCKNFTFNVERHGSLLNEYFFN